MILEEEGALLAAPKEAVAVAFICKLRGFRLLSLSADTMFPAKLGKKRGSSPRKLCTPQEPGSGMGGTQLETTKMAEVHRSKSLSAGVKILYGRPQLTFLIPQAGKARVFRFSHTKDALSSLKMILLLLLICGPRGREAGAFLKRKIKAVRGIQSRPLIDDAADGLRQASPLLDSISN
jgi:hypothetical protein